MDVFGSTGCLVCFDGAFTAVVAVDDETSLALLRVKINAMSGNCSFGTYKKDMTGLFS